MPGVGSPTVLLVAGRGVLGLECLAADPPVMVRGVYCLARIQNYRGGWQLYMTLNRSLAGDYCEAQHVGEIPRPSATRAATEARLTSREYRKQLALASR